MKLNRSKEWWIANADAEPDCPISAGIPDKEEDMSEPFTKKNVAEMADKAAEEIESLRRSNAALAPKAHAYDTVSAILGLLPQQSQGYGEDMAWRLRKRASELREADDGEAA